MSKEIIDELVKSMDGSISFDGKAVKVLDPQKVKAKIYELAKASALGAKEKQGWARYMVRLIAAELGIFPASINDLYMGRGQKKVPSTFTVPAMNLRVLAYDAARAVFRAAKDLDTAAMIFEIARSEMNYCDQRPTEYTTSILSAAIAEGYKGPVFIQGDHFQISAKKYAADPASELKGLYELVDEAVAAGFYNIDVDTSTLVDLDKTTVPEQQALNVELSAKIAAYVRSKEPKGVTISIGGEIGEVGGHNSNETELRAYLDGFKTEFGKMKPGAAGLSKISIQTGTSHGGVVLPDGSIAKVKVDFDTMKELSAISRDDYGMGGAVQHGASTLPEDAFGKFPEAEACEIHLATNFMNMFFDMIPEDLKAEMYKFLDDNYAAEKKPDMTAEQFYYKSRKWAVGPFKKQSWMLPDDVKKKIDAAWEAQFKKLFTLLKLAGTRKYVDQVISKTVVAPDVKAYLGESGGDADVSDLAD